jgi:uncharacterized membrane protein YhhN
MAEGATDRWVKWRTMTSDLADRFRKPRYEPVFVFYFVFVIVLAGSIGAWLPFFEGELPHAGPSEMTPLLQSLIAREEMIVPRELAIYFAGLLAAIMGDILLAKDAKQTYRMIGFCAFFIAFCLAVACWGAKGKCTAYLFSIPGFIITLCLWWTANADNERLQDPVPPADTALAGDPNRDLSGSLDGIES